MQLTAEKDAHITQAEGTIRQFESEIEQLQDAATRWVSKPLPIFPCFFKDYLCPRSNKLHTEPSTLIPQGRGSPLGRTTALRGVDQQTKRRRG